MKLISAYDDFVERTLSRIEGKIQRLTFLAKLHGKGKYEHWGMSQTYGEEQADSALGTAHSESWTDLLRTKISSVFLGKKIDESELNALSKTEAAERVVPDGSTRSSVRHFRFIIETLTRLTRGVSRRAS